MRLILRLDFEAQAVGKSDPCPRDKLGPWRAEMIMEYGIVWRPR